MYTPHQSALQFSPQRRQVLGTSKRVGQKKAHLGDEEAHAVGPQQLFADLKGNSGSKAGSVFGKSPSRALGVKNSQSPQKSLDASVPDKAKAVAKERAAAVDASPTKAANGKGKAPSKAERQVSPVRQAPAAVTPLPSPHGLDEGTSYLTAATPFPAAPRTPSAEGLQSSAPSRQASFVTPPGNVGAAGAVRMRKGELLDAMSFPGEVDQDEPAELTQEQIEEELYPEIEYMPPHVEAPFDFPPQLDGLPRAKELGQSMAKLSLAGSYRPADEEKKREILAEVFRFQPGRPTQPNLVPPPSREERDEQWPDVEVVLPAPIRPSASKTAVRNVKSVGSKPVRNASQTKALDPVAQKKVAHGSEAAARSARLHAPPSPKKSSAPARKPKALGERDANTTVKKRVMNPALRDFENDPMGKIISAKLQASEDQEPQGFVL